MRDVKSALSNFDIMTLEELTSRRFLSRRDTKFVFNQTRLPSLLRKVESNLRVLDVNGHRMIPYENLYFDTDDFLFYRQHHNQKLNRYKVRMRRYIEPGLCYFEIKFKDNKQRVVKRRIRIPRITNSLSEDAKRMIQDIIGVSPEELSPKLKVTYSRITLADGALKNRVTIDGDIVVESVNVKKQFRNLVIAEVKWDEFRPRSGFPEIMKELLVREVRISKYCMGILHTYEGVKYNRFKPKMLLLDRIISD